MFVKQIDVREALELAEKGVEVKILAPNVKEPKTWMDYYPDTLQEMLDGCLFFRQEPAMEDAEFKQAVQKMEKAAKNPPPNTARAAAEPSGGSAEQASRRVGVGTKRRKIDVGKLFALKKAGWTQAKIADELGVSEATVSVYIKKGLPKGDLN